MKSTKKRVSVLGMASAGLSPSTWPGRESTSPFATSISRRGAQAGDPAPPRLTQSTLGGCLASFSERREATKLTGTIATSILGVSRGLSCRAHLQQETHASIESRSRCNPHYRKSTKVFIHCS
jgi:hypothetical protein